MRKNADKALKELSSISKKVTKLQDVVHRRISSLYEGEGKLLVFHETDDSESVLVIWLINLNRVIAKYRYKTEQNNLYMVESNTLNINANGEHEDVQEYLIKLESALEREYDCSVIK